MDEFAKRKRAQQALLEPPAATWRFHGSQQGEKCARFSASSIDLGGRRHLAQGRSVPSPAHRKIKTTRKSNQTATRNDKRSKEAPSPARILQDQKLACLAGRLAEEIEEIQQCGKEAKAILPARVQLDGHKAKCRELPLDTQRRGGCIRLLLSRLRRALRRRKLNRKFKDQKRRLEAEVRLEDGVIDAWVEEEERRLSRRYAIDKEFILRGVSILPEIEEEEGEEEEEEEEDGEGEDDD